MNQVYRALHMPPQRLMRKLLGSKEIYTIALRRRNPEAPLPVLGEGAFTPLPYSKEYWYADPMLVQRDGKTWLFCEAFLRAEDRGELAVFPLDENGTPGPMQTVLRESYHLSFPNVFEWAGETWMIPETCGNHSLNLYCCEEFPGKWVTAKVFDVGCELCDTIVLEQTADSLTLLCSETVPDNQVFVRWRLFTLRWNGKDFELEENEDFSLNHRDFNLSDRNAGPLFQWGGQTIHPTQVSTKVDYGVYLQFFVCDQAGRPGKLPLCAVEPGRVEITGLPAKDIVGVHTYGCTDTLEVIDARYLHKEES